ncbi:MAG: hypothetical protein V7739_18305 [Motiliproteus sp.]
MSIQIAFVSIVLIFSSPLHAEVVSLVEPDELNILPSHVVSDLKKSGCKVPVAESYRFGGALIGEFAAPNQIDLAVICVTDDSRSIRMYWGGPKKCMSVLSSAGQFIQLADEHLIYNYMLSEYENPVVPSMNHLAIDDVMLGKASEVSYCDNGQWKYLGGAD